MSSIEEMHGNKLMAWWRRHSTALHVGAMSSSGLGYLLNAGYTHAAVLLSTVSLGGVTLYCFLNGRCTLRAKDLVVITGCNSGLGYSLAMHCRARGATVLAGIREQSETTTSTAITETLKKKDIFYQDLDITNEKSVKMFGQRIKKLIEERQLVLHALVNNAGMMVFGEFEWQTQALAEQQVNVNLLGTMRLTRELMPIARENGSRIIVVTSHCAIDPLPGVSVYGATKAALHAWTAALRVEVGKYGIKVISFMPGGFVTQSNIMKRQRLHFDEMKSHMSDEAKQFYGNYFTRYAEYFSHASLSAPSTSSSVVTNPRIYEIFDGALLDNYPSDFYRCESWRYFFYRILFKITPTWMRDRLVQRFVAAPSW